MATKKSHILIVEDEQFFRQLYVQILEEEGCQVDAVASGDEALARLSQGGIDIVLTDLVMPGSISGLGVLRMARDLPNPPEVILATGHATIETAIKALKNGARDYLIKPFKTDELRHLVRTCLEQRRLLDENIQLKNQVRLFQRGSRLASLLELDQLLPKAVAALLEETGGGRGFAFLLEEGEVGKVLGLTGLAEKEASALAAALTPGLDDLSGMRLVHGPQLQSLGATLTGVQSLCLFPLRHQSTLEGAVVIANPLERDFARPLPQENLLFLSEQATLGFENAFRYQGAQQLIYTDDLTGLYNHRYLHRVLNQELRRAKRYNLEFSLVFIDLDHFKDINDTHGHLAGSKTLKELAGILTRCVRDADLLFRYGGDEFTIILIETGARAAAAITERIRKTIEEHIFLQDVGVSSRLTATFGYATFPDDASSEKELIDSADRAMYHGKKIRNVIRGVWELPQG